MFPFNDTYQGIGTHAYICICIYVHIYVYCVCVCVKTTNTDVKTLRATEKAKDKEIDDLWRKLRLFFFQFPLVV